MAYQSPMPSQQFLQDVFHRVDLDRSGHITADELQKALSNGTWNPFNYQTVKLMVSMFDKQGRGTVSFHEFGALWKYVTDWQQCFKSFDRDNSGSIDCNEFATALRTFGYQLSPQTINMLMAKFDTTRRGSILFDDFICCCILLNNLTISFRELDTDMDGVITIHYENFLSMIFRNTAI